MGKTWAAERAFTRIAAYRVFAHLADLGLEKYTAYFPAIVRRG